MGYIRFLKVDIEGFMSIKSSTVELTDRGMTFIKGVNEFEPLSKSNGAGKSAIFESIIWCLTGSTSRNSSNIVNRFTDTGAKVELDFLVDEIAYTVTRAEKHQELGTSLKIIRNGEDISGNTLTKSKSVLKDELGQLNYDTLTSIIIMSQGLPGRLSALKPSQRKARLEELSNMDSYIKDLETRLSQANTRLDSDKLELNKQISNLEGQIAANQSSIDRTNDRIKMIAQQSENLIDEQTYNDYKLQVDNMTKYLSDMEQFRINESSNLANLRFEVQSIAHNMSNLKSEVSNLMLQISNLDNGGNCPTCHRPMTEISVVEQLRADYNSKIAQITNQLATIGPEYLEKSNSLTNRESELSKYDGEITNTRNDLNTMLEKIKAYENFSSTNEVLVDDIKVMNESITSLRSEVFTNQSKLNKVLSDIAKASYVKKSISRKFRSFLLQGVVEYVNAKCSEYSRLLFKEQGEVSLAIEGNNISIKLGDQYFEELSGGESRRVDIVLQLVQRDLARNESGFTSNILVLDEILDYLDSSGVECVLDLIDSKSSECESVLIVSHKEDVKIPYDDVLTVVKRSDRLSYVV